MLAFEGLLVVLLIKAFLLFFLLRLQSLLLGQPANGLFSPILKPLYSFRRLIAVD